VLLAEKISPSKLRIGLAIKLPLNWMKHPFMSSKLIIENLHEIRIIQSLKLEFVYYYPEKSRPEPVEDKTSKADVLKQIDAAAEYRAQLQEQKSARIEESKVRRRNIQKTEKAFTHSFNQLHSLMKKVGSQPVTAIEEASQLTANIAEQMNQQDALSMHMIATAQKDQENLYYHALNVSTLSMLLARNLKLSTEQIQIVGFGGLFHDIGKLRLPSQILRKKEPLTKPEQNLLNLHTQYGAELALNLSTFPSEAINILMQHHEYMDGSGFPKGLKEADIDPLAKIVAVVNTFDNLCHPGPAQITRSPHTALSYMYRKMKDQLPATELKLLIKMMGIYPPGTMVQLNDERIGMVITVNSDSLLQPDVMLYDADIPRMEAPILTVGQDGLTIEKALKPLQLPAQVLEYLNPCAKVSYYVQGKQ
jgi:putative nucleotidyltransferase with HDIG domain